MRLIKADKIPKAIYAEDDNITGMGMTEDEMEAYNDGIDEQWAKIKNAPTVEVPKWIPCSERLPLHGSRVLVTATHKKLGHTAVDVFRYHGDDYGWENSDFCTVTAWMPLPEPWKGECE